MCWNRQSAPGRRPPLNICQNRKNRQRRDHKQINKFKIQTNIFEILALIKRTFSILHYYIKWLVRAIAPGVKLLIKWNAHKKLYIFFTYLGEFGMQNAAGCSACSFLTTANKIRSECEQQTNWGLPKSLFYFSNNDVILHITKMRAWSRSREICESQQAWI